MAISASELVKKLRNGERVVCSVCGKGYMKGMTNSPANAETHFACTVCKEKLILNIKHKTA